MSLLEGLALLETDGGIVIVAVADEPVPEPFGEDRDYEALALAYCLAAEAPPGRGLAVLEGLERRRCTYGGDLPERFAGNPAAAGLPLLQTILDGGASLVPVELGVDEPYSVEVRTRAEA
jgi:hypothetical protein